MTVITDGYKVLQTVRETPSSRIYKCLDARDGAVVAFKIMLSTDPETISSFHAQADLLSRINHPFLGGLRDWGLDERGHSYLVTEWAEEGSLGDKIRWLSLTEKKSVTAQLCEALDFLHSLGYVHGDIKPNNVLLLRDGDSALKARISDFEFVRSGGSTTFYEWQGTIAYMAPELIRGEPVDYSSDLYSLGVLIFELFTGTLPFREKDPFRLASAQLDQEPDLSRAEQSSLPVVLLPVIESLLKKNPAERVYSSSRIRDLILGNHARINLADQRLGLSLIDFWFYDAIQAEMGETDLANLINSIFPGLEPKGELSRFLFQKTSGSPKIVKTYLEGLVQQQGLSRESGRWSLKASLDDFRLKPETCLGYLPSSLEALSSPQASLVKSCSIFKLGAQLEVLLNLSRLGPTFEPCLNSLVGAGWLVVSFENDEKSIRFRNGLIQEYILENMPKGQVQHLCQQAIQLLGSIQGKQTQGTLEELLHLNLMTGDRPAVLRYALLLSDITLGKGQKSVALNYLLTASGYVSSESEVFPQTLFRIGEVYYELGEPNLAVEYYRKYLANNACPGPGLFEVRRKLGWCQALLSDFENAEQYLNQCLEGPRVRGDNTRLTLVLLDLASCKHMQRQYGECKAILKECGRLLDGGEDKHARARFHNIKGILEWSLGDYQSCIQDYQKSIKVYEALNSPPELGKVANNLGLVFRELGRYDQAHACLLKGLENAKASNDSIRISSGCNNLSLVCRNLRMYERGIAYAKSAMELAIKLSNREVEALAHNNLGFLLLAKGSLNESLYHLRQAANCFNQIKNRSGLALVYYNQGEIYRIRQLQQLAIDYFKLSLEIRRELDEKPGVADCLAGLARVYLENLELNSCEEYLNEANRLYHQLGKHEEKALLSSAYAEALSRLELTDSAMAELEKVSQADPDFKSTEIGSHLNLVKGLIALNLKNYDSAGKHLLSSLKSFKAEQDLVAQAKSCYYLGWVYRLENRTRLGRKFWREAAGIYRQLRVEPKVEELEKLIGETEAMTRDREQIQTLSKVSQLLAQIEDEDELLNQVLGLAIELLGAERGAIIYYDQASSSFELKVSFGLEQETGQDAVDISRRTIKEVSQTGKTFISKDAQSELSLKDHQSVRMHNILSILCAPLIINEQIIGTIYLDNRTLTRAFSEEDLDFVEALSNLLALAVSKAKNFKKLCEENFQLSRRAERIYDYPNIIAKGPPMQEVLTMVSKVAPTKASVLITGENGTGKELIANLIHNLSDRKGKSFVRVNCAAIPDSLLESELFGVEEGVATGVGSREGKFELADGGTIFLDEIGDMNLTTQAKVLRVLQEREFERVGGNRTIKVDIRVISATNKNLPGLTKELQFRPDLYYRINAVTIPLPPLRERTEDVPFLIDFFLDKFCGENQKSKLRLDPGLIRLLCNYEWPGNIRELMNVIERGVIFAEGEQFAYSQLPISVTEVRASGLKKGQPGKMKQTLARMEKQFINEALRQTNWHQAKAAKILGMPEPTLARKISLYKLKKPRKL
ncbi:MAG: hypothetical protein A2Z27_05200 [candidate division Zixibacteria bacterium RBG_16_50_21]|nr:MAG: hypothetical protein A2Z27_05200 [candidate division Zixibacteria bacterium RBG_16_50_21]